MNRQQIIDVLKGLTVAGGPIALLLVQFGGMDSAGAEKIVGAIGSIITVAGLVWLAIGRTDRNMVVDAGSVPGVQVHVNTDPTAKGAFPVAPESVQQVALDRGTNTDVVPMVGGPRADSNKESP